MANMVHQAPPGGTSTPVDYITMQEALSTAAALAAASTTTTTTAPSSSLQQQARISPAPIAPIAARSAQVLLANNNNTMLPTVTPCTTQQAFPYVSYATQPSQLLIFPAPGPFDQLKLRRGKWTSEEEAYAELLIVEFEKGTVEGCENGCTLRSFLSKKLHCAPMRISKKYAGMCIIAISCVSTVLIVDPFSHNIIHTRKIDWKARVSIQSDYCKWDWQARREQVEATTVGNEFLQVAVSRIRG